MIVTLNILIFLSNILPDYPLLGSIEGCHERFYSKAQVTIHGQLNSSAMLYQLPHDFNNQYRILYVLSGMGVPYKTCFSSGVLV